MGLSPSAPRRHLHSRTYHCEGFAREDGLWDIEVRMVDTKTYAVDEPFRGHRPAGAHVHEMHLRLTLDAEKTVHDIEVATAHAPYEACFTVAPAYKRLVGASIARGWRRAVQEAVGGTEGCTHLKEMLMPAATVAFQTMGSWRQDADVEADAAAGRVPEKPSFIDGCKAWSAEGPVVERLYPVYFRPRIGG
jgi:hypothetical protein